MAWLLADDVAAHLRLPAPDTLTETATTAAQSWVELHRSDLTWTPEPAPGTAPEGPHVYQGAVLFAALLYQAGASPEGFPGWDDAGGMVGVADSAGMSRVYRLLRGRRPAVG